MEKQLKECGEVQVSTSDPESRQMITRNNITEVAYNIRRIMSILGKDELEKYLKELVLMFSCKIQQRVLYLSPCKAIKSTDKIIADIYYDPLKRLIFYQLLMKSTSF